jgi:hypothetical protein
MVAENSHRERSVASQRTDLPRIGREIGCEWNSVKWSRVYGQDRPGTKSLLGKEHNGAATAVDVLAFLL